MKNFQFNFIWKKGQRTNLPTQSQMKEKILLVEPNKIAKIRMHYWSCNTFDGFELFDKEGNCLLSAIACVNPNKPPKDILLQDGERILGVISRLTYPND